MAAGRGGPVGPALAGRSSCAGRSEYVAAFLEASPNCARFRSSSRSRFHFHVHFHCDFVWAQTNYHQLPTSCRVSVGPLRNQVPSSGPSWSRLGHLPAEQIQRYTDAHKHDAQHDHYGQHVLGPGARMSGRHLDWSTASRLFLGALGRPIVDRRSSTKHTHTHTYRGAANSNT